MGARGLRRSQERQAWRHELETGGLWRMRTWMHTWTREQSQGWLCTRGHRRCGGCSDCRSFAAAFVLMTVCQSQCHSPSSSARRSSNSSSRSCSASAPTGTDVTTCPHVNHHMYRLLAWHCWQSRRPQAQPGQMTATQRRQKRWGKKAERSAARSPGPEVPRHHPARAVHQSAPPICMHIGVHHLFVCTREHTTVRPVR